MDIDLMSILETPTHFREEKMDTGETQEVTDFSGFEFDEIPEDTTLQEEKVETLEIEVYNAEENAEILIELIDVVNIQTLTPLAKWKLAKKQGGKPVVRKMQILYEKKMNEGELTEKEKRQIELYQIYLKDKQELENAIPYTDEEKESLKQAAIPYLKSSKLKIGGGAAFWTQLAMIQGSRIMQVLTA